MHELNKFSRNQNFSLHVSNLENFFFLSLFQMNAYVCYAIILDWIFLQNSSASVIYEDVDRCFAIPNILQSFLMLKRLKLTTINTDARRSANAFLKYSLMFSPARLL